MMLILGVLVTSFQLLTVTPDGYVFAWHNPTEPGFSDVLRLNASGHHLADFSSQEGAWPDGATRALVGNGTIPQHILNFPAVATLDDCGVTAMLMVEASDNRYRGDYTSDAALFIADQFGVDARAIDWQAAIKARLINASFADIAPFDPVTAGQALRLAAGNSARPGQVRGQATRSALSHTDPARHPRPGTNPTQ